MIQSICWRQRRDNVSPLVKKRNKPPPTERPRRIGSNIAKSNERQSRSTAERMFAAEADRLGSGDQAASGKRRSSGGLPCSASARRLGIGEGAGARASNLWNIPREDCANEARSSSLSQPMHKPGGDRRSVGSLARGREAAGNCLAEKIEGRRWGFGG